MNKTRLGSVALALISSLAFGLTLASHAAHASPIAGNMLVQVIGEVRSVDVDARRVNVVDAQGHASQINVGQDVHDLDNLPIGARITSTVLQPVTLTVARAGKPQSVLPGDRQFIVRVESVDATTGVVMLSDANSLPIEVRTHDPLVGTLSPHATVHVRLTNTPRDVAQTGSP